MAAGIFQLTGWLQTLEMLQDPEQVPAAKLELYLKCLDWYINLFEIQSGYDADIDNIEPGESAEALQFERQFKRFTV